MLPSTFSRTVASATLAVGGLLAAGNAAALVSIPVQTTFNFTGTCSDCILSSPPVIATLVLEDYTAGAAIAIANFVEFTYNGSDIVDPFTVTRDTFYPEFSDTVSGAIPAAGGAAAFRISFGDVIGFESTTSGIWFACAPGSGVYNAGSCSLFRHNDVGIGAWSASAPVPEPASMLMMAIGVAGLAGMAMRRRQSAED